MRRRGLKKALEMIGNLTAVPEIGKVYLGKVVRLAEFGAFVELFPGTDGLLHISEIAEHRVKEVKDELSEGDQIMVKVLAIEAIASSSAARRSSASRSPSWGRRLRRLLKPKRWRRALQSLRAPAVAPPSPAMSSTSVSPNRTRAPS